ncbi:cell wall-binding protein, partial [[Clostridium] scindens]|nr:cell wall-binding protein [[Clostridium] scindens]MCB7194929.1 cell wall-binding protein [[Clostridium] scindens]MCB7288128.1 cell wall-binding protein [[Clostridium] scindens]
GWLYQGNTWYYLNADGKMMTGWQTIGDSKYYLYGSGAMAVGRAQVDGVEYDFGTDGRCRE